ncbi:hypothetical protein K6119_09555 [Paracrocinitomix mangrovi]|uniref:DUF7793 family protein n=1 Tax=Paracrocinitomix mangrovi TaxID=2862509 RepID=UPI001C8E7CCC|nr:hypothetical protein [Paracrocinitomix mangrovi]UKN03736.1 hypothetical protein K6119_09555 [Paracrocinitomix mangrovi]
MFRVRKAIEELGFFKATLYENGIIHISWDKEINMIETKHLAKMQEVVCKLGDGEKMPLYFTTHAFLQVSEEAQSYATSQEGTRYSKAIAVLVEDLATKIDYNIFLKKNTPVVPTQAFGSMEEAFEWLITF